MWERIAAFFLSVLMLFASALGGQTGKPAVTTERQADYTLYQNLSYGSHERQNLDLALPASHTGDTVGLILMLHAGGWTMGDRSVYNGAIRAYAARGYAAAAIDYHYVSDTVHMDTLMNDITLALKKIKAFALQRQVPIEACLLTGGSAGGHLSLLYAYSMQAAAPIRPAAVVSYCGPTDLTLREQIEHSDLGSVKSMLRLLSRVSGVTLSERDYRRKSGAYDEAMQALRAYSPLYHVDSAVPTVIAHGERDTVVPFAGAQALDAALEARGIAHTFVPYPNSGHALSDDPPQAEQTAALLLAYAETYL